MSNSRNLNVCLWLLDLSIPLSFGEDEDSDASQNDASARYSEDEDEWDRLQADSKNRDILDAKSKESHVVHAPYFPEVNANTNGLHIRFPVLSRLFRDRRSSLPHA